MATYNLTIFPEPQRRNRIKLLTGQRFSRLLVLGFAGSNGKRAMWHCLCSCGNTLTTNGSALISRRTKSCGCLHDEGPQPQHGGAVSGQYASEYRSYNHAKARCENLNDKSYHRYGGRGIEFRFQCYEDFLSEIGHRPSPKHSLDRIDNNGHYEKGNIRWATSTEQSSNRRSNRIISAFGESLILKDWATRFNRRRGTIEKRLHSGWCAECAIGIPVRSGNCPHR